MEGVKRADRSRCLPSIRNHCVRLTWPSSESTGLQYDSSEDTPCDVVNKPSSLQLELHR